MRKRRLIGTVVGSVVLGIAFWVLPAVWLVSCSQGAGHGRPETLNPILGHHGVGIPRTTPSEPVRDYAVDLGTFRPAWPAVGSELPRLIRAVIARGTWTDEHHSAIASNGVLRVRHRPEVVSQVRKLVDDLRARLLRPLDIQVAFVEIKTGVLDRVFRRGSKHPGGGGRWSGRAFRAAVGRGEARSLARVVLPTHNGRWALSDRVSNQVFLSGITIENGAITPQTTALASGFTIQAAAWRWGEEKAVCAITGLYTAPAGEANGEQSITQTVHRELPRLKTTERQWEAHEVTLQLPVREMLEFQNQLTIKRNAWTVAAVLPRNKAHVNAVLVKIDWRSPPPRKVSIDPLSKKGYVLEVIPVALPTDTRPYKVDKKTEIDNRREIAANSVEWFKDRAKTYQQAQKSNTYNLQSKSGAFAPTQGWLYGSFRKGQQVVQGGEMTPTSGLMPRRIERLRDKVMRAAWPEGTALEFVANHVFVVHERAMTKKVRSLLEQTHGWRNRQVFIDAAFPVLDAAAADKLRGTTVGRGQASTLCKKTALPGAFLLARGGAWAEIFVGEMHTVISKAWAPDRSSPPVHVYWRGSRLAAQPHLGVAHPERPEGARGPGIQRTEIRWKQHRLERVAPRVVAGTILQQPVDSIWAHDQLVHLGPRAAVLVGLHGDEELRAVLLSSSVR